LSNEGKRLVALLIEFRKEQRHAKAFSQADELRSRLLELGIVLEDTPQDTLWRYRK